MKTAILPAQVTNIEDTIGGSLSLTQVILLVLPVFIAAIIFAIIPPLMGYDVFKLILLCLVSMPILVLAIRVKKQLILHWLLLVGAYVYRPKMYLLSFHDLKNHSCLNVVNNNYPVEANQAVPLETKTLAISELEASDFIEFNNHYQTKKLVYYPDDKGNIYATFVD